MTMTAPDEIFPAAMTAHQAGSLAEAESLYRQILTLAPDHTDSLHFLGLVAYKTGRLQAAATLLQRAVRLAPALAEAHYNLATILSDLGRTDAAEAGYLRALALKPDFAQAHFNLANLLSALGRPGEAADRLRQTLTLEPAMAQAHGNLGNALLGLEQFEAAKACYCRALALEPNSAEALGNLGNALRELGEFEAAEAMCRRALAINPGLPGQHSNLGNALVDLGRLEDARDSYLQTLRLKPDFAEAYTNLGSVLKDLGLTEAAVIAHSRALALDPSLCLPRMNRALTRFARGETRTAWDDFEARWDWKKQSRKRPFTQPWWAGHHGGDDLLIWGEQGIGDEIIGVGMLPDLTARGASILLECDPRLTDLFARSFPGIGVIARQDPPHPRTAQARLQTPLMGLGKHVRATLADFPRHTGYLSPDAAKARHWKGWLDGLGPGLKIGISWRGRFVRTDRSRHFVPLDDLGDILSIPGLVFVNLQYDGHTEEIAALQKTTGHIIHSPPGLDLTDDLDGVAAVMSGLDAVIGPATAVAILAGALGRPTWMYALFPASNEKEVLGCDHVPWCPSIRVEAHGHGGDWSETLGRLGHSLRRWIDGVAPPP